MNLNRKIIISTCGIDPYGDLEYQHFDKQKIISGMVYETR